MGLLGKLFGSEKEHAPLDPSSPAAATLGRSRQVLEAFAAKVQDRLEVVPGERTLWVFVGKPPGSFGIAWLQDGEEHNFKKLMKDKGLSAARVQTLSDKLREAYVRAKGEERFSDQVAGRTVLVHPSASLEREVAGIIREVAG
jgi:hypothetical protein